MGIYLQPLVSCRLIIRQQKKDIGEIEKYSQKNVRVVYNSFCVCVCVDYIRVLMWGYTSDWVRVCV